VLKSSIAQAVVVTGLSFGVPACSFAAPEVGLSPKNAVRMAPSSDLSVSSAMAGGATADPSISADLKGKWCFDDGARVSVQRTINISLPQQLPAQEFDDEAGIWHMYMDPAPFPGLPKGTARLLIPGVHVSPGPSGTIRIVQITAPWSDLVPSSWPERFRKTQFFTVSFFQGKIYDDIGRQQLAFEVDVRFEGRDKLVVTDISLTFDAGRALTSSSDGAPISLSRC
jgi:hypothetical protein